MVKLQERLDLTFSALSDETRRSILQRLRNGPRTVTELARPFSERMSLAAVSKHLKVLENADLVTRKKQGRQFLIGLKAKPFKEAEKWLDSYRAFWEGNLDRLSDYVDSQKENRTGRERTP